MNLQIRVDMIILEYHPIVGGAQRQLALLAPLLQAVRIIKKMITSEKIDKSFLDILAPPID